MGPILRLVRYGFTIEIYGLPFWHVPLMRTEVDAMAPERIAISINQSNFNFCIHNQPEKAYETQYINK